MQDRVCFAYCTSFYSFDMVIGDYVLHHIGGVQSPCPLKIVMPRTLGVPVNRA